LVEVIDLLLPGGRFSPVALDGLLHVLRSPYFVDLPGRHESM
jgi:hypothetical protein